jgi:hypothetical protein
VAAAPVAQVMTPLVQALSIVVEAVVELIRVLAAPEEMVVEEMVAAQMLEQQTKARVAVAAAI